MNFHSEGRIAVTHLRKLKFNFCPIKIKTVWQQQQDQSNRADSSEMD